ncbi:alpha-L-rhamnosidase C-terminal domain-containing protein [Phytobacter sp. V91]|uniref:alpha-L-rhamnosidase C-terminal domain-containing protein n=1 Tax=Phytobacter sp. V91 TaxID=3369425 RepID=UPI003F617785
MESCPGFKRAHIEPHPNYRLGSVALTAKTAAGAYQISWAISTLGDISIKVTVPFDCTARLTLVDIDKLAKLRTQGSTPVGVEQDDRLIIELTAGSYCFEYTPLVDYIPRYNIDMPIRELLRNSETKLVLEKHIPDVLALPFLGLLENESLQTIATKPFFHYPPQVLDGISQEIACHTVA